MERAEFLEKLWLAYPPAERGWQDVARYLPESNGGIASVNVCGRLECLERVGEPGACWALVSGGARLEVVFADDCQWLGTRTQAELTPTLLRSGDLVCVALTAVNEGQPHAAGTCRLLVPVKGDFALASAFTQERSRHWQSLAASVREFFLHRGFVEAVTPTLVPSPGTEPFLEPFTTEWRMGSLSRRVFLPTSPEFHLKKMLVAGWTRVFELKTCFRNGEVGPHHQPEFTMLEWYRAYDTLDSIADDVDALLASASVAAGRPPPQLQRTTMRELFAAEFPGFRLEPETTRDQLASLARAQGIAIVDDGSNADSWDEIFFRIFLEKIEPRLGKTEPVLVRGYPPSQAALSRIGPDGFADRFEVYWRGLELANAFHELNDPLENERRFAADLAAKRARGFSPVPLDAELRRALEHGLPPSGGIALGLDRLFMAIYGIELLADTRAFPYVEDATSAGPS